MANNDDKVPMNYRVTGIGLEPLEYREETLARAAYLASKMADNGVRDVRVFDKDGRQISDKELSEAPVLPGWQRHPEG